MKKFYHFITSKPGHQTNNFNFLKACSLKKITSSACTLLLLFCINSSFAQGPYPAWEYSRSVKLSNATPFANFQVKVTISSGQYANMKADGSDLRFYDNNSVACNYWIENWNNAGTSVIWVNVPSAAANALDMYYGNPGATAVSNGNNTFDFFDDFSGSSLNANWLSYSPGGTIAVSNGKVTLNNTTGNIVSMYSAFTPASTSFIIEAKHKEGAYYRNKFYATTDALVSNSINDNNPIGGDYGYFSNGSVNNPAGTLYWKGFQAAVLNAGTDYLTRWDITEGANYSWSTYNYNSGSLINTNSQTVTASIRDLAFKVTENTASTTVDWARVRKADATEITTTVGSETSRLPVPVITGLGSLNGCAGKNITINGTGFTTAFGLSVKTGGTPVSSIVSNNGTTIVAVVAAGTTGTVTVTTSGGTGSSAEIFTITLSPTASAGSALTAICQGSTSTGLGGSVGGSVTGGTWDDGGIGGIFTPDANSLNATWTPPASYSGVATFTLTSTVGACGAATATKTLTVNPLPTGVLAASATSICAGSSVTFTAPPGYNLYNFSLNGASIQTGSSNIFSSTSLITGDIITVTIYTNAFCTATFTAPAVTVNKYPSGEFTVSENSGLITNDNIVCQGDMVNFAFDNIDGNTNYRFINGATTLYSGPNPYFSTGLPAQANVTLEVTGAGACVKAFGPQVIKVNPLPAGSLIIEENSGIANDTAICIGSDIRFTAPAGYANYDFQVSGFSVQSGTSNVFHTSTLVDNDKVSVIITNSNNCSVTIGPVPVSVNALPAVSAITGPSQLCVNSTAALANVIAGGQWSSLDITVATIDASGIVTGVSAGTATIIYKVTNLNGCDSTVKASVTVNALPTVASITGTLDVCVGNSTQLDEATAGGTWSSNNSAVATINSSGFVNGISAGTATISYSVTNGNGCTTIIIASITVHALPVIAPISGALSACVNTTTSLSDATGGGTWSSDNTAIATVNSATGVVTGLTPGAAIIRYSLTDDANCSASITAEVIVRALPVVTLTGPNPICLGSVGNIYNTEAGQTNYTWNITGGVITAGGSSADNTVTVSWTSPGTKKINVNYTNTNGCTASTSATFVNSAAVMAVITGPATVCLNSSGNIYTTDALKNEYTWTVNGGTITAGGSSDDNTATVTWNASGTQSISVNYANADGCNAAAPTLRPVTVKTLPTANISGTTSACQNGTAPNVTFTGAKGTRGYSFTYNINGSGTYVAATSTASNTVTVAAPIITAGIYDYNLISVSDANGCTQPASGTATITVIATPSASISYAGGSFCTSAAPVSVAFSGTTGGTFSSTNGLSINSADGTITPSTSSQGTYTVSYKVSAPGGCAVFIATATVTIASLPTANISYAASSFCISLSSGQPVTLTGTGAYTGGTYSAASGLNINSTSGIITPNASSAGSYVVTYTTLSAGCGSIATTTSVTITNVPSAFISYTGTPFCSTLTSVPVSISGTGAYSGGTYSSGATLSINAVSGNINPSLSIAGTYIVTYAIPASGGCAAAAVTTSVIITASPSVNAGNAVSTCASSGAVNITAGSAAANYNSVTWTSNGTGTWTNANSLSAATYNPGTADISAGSVILSLTATGSGNCSSVASTKTLTINANPATVVITPGGATLCQGTIQALTSVGNAASSFTSTFSSDNTSLTIPDNSFTGVYKTIAVSGIPTGAVITGMSIKFNITHGYAPDVFINLKAPNNKVLNVADGLGASVPLSSNYTNTVISSTSAQPIQTFGVAPFTGNYLPQAQTGAPGSTSVPGGSTQVSNTSFPDLYSVINGSWYFSVRDGGAGDIGTLDSWSITINYTIPANPITWAPLTGLYTDATATLAYAGQNLSVVYAKPATPGVKTYIATAVNAAGCQNSTNVILTVNPSPVLTVTADYCVNPGNVMLYAHTASGASYTWSNGSTDSVILVDEAQDFSVSATNSVGCVSTSQVSIARELVTNGDFTAGNTGFISGYTYYPDVAGNNELVNDTGTNGYAVGTSGQNYHPSFYGKDHTNNQTGPRNFMLVNGHGSITVWQQTVNVLPNTNYYYSAWAMNLYPVSNARLQFQVNGVAIGTIAELSSSDKPTSNAQVNLNNWTRFYYGNTNGWYSGSATTAVIRIIDLNTVAFGNDFALDDISFATLSPFVVGPGVYGTDNQEVCAEMALTPITYKVGSGAAGPQVLNLPPGVSYTFDGLTVTISGTPSVPGNYNYTVATTGSCPNSQAAHGVIKVNPKATVTLTSAGKDVQTVCLNSNITSITYAVGGVGTGITFSGLPAGITGSYINGTASISGIPSVSGTFNYNVKTYGNCKVDSSGGTITVRPASVGGSVFSPTICIGGLGTLILSGNVGNVDHWETSGDGITYTRINNTSNTQSFSNITQSAFYRVMVKSDVCPADYSTGGKIKINNFWEGKFSSDWSTPQNWSSGNMPDNSCLATVTISKVTGGNYNPVITTTAAVTNLNLTPNANLTINGGNLQVSGAITNNGILDAGNGSVEYTGSAQQNIAPNTFLNNNIKNLKISNSNTLGVTMFGPADVYRSLTYGTNGKTLNTNGFLTLKSTATETAWLGDMTGRTITGNVTVERYIGTGSVHAKSWQLLAVPTTGQTIKQSWQEGATATNVSLHVAGSAGNPFAGYGTMLTSDVPNATMQSTPGFDAATAPGPSIKVYNSATDAYVGPTSTGLPIYNQKGYFILVRGDRSIYTSGAGAVPTVLRTKGTLFTPANLPPSTTVLAGKSESVGNPYASAIDLRKLSLDAGVNSTIIVWDPTLGMGSLYGLGAYQTLYLNGDGNKNGTNNYINLLPSAAYGPAGTTNNNIQSGQAFIIQALPAVNGNLSFTESAKANDSKLLLRSQSPLDDKNAQLRTNLYGINASGTFLADGALIQYNDVYSGSIDGLDARKMGNSAENLAIKTGGMLLAIERRHTITQQDTIFLNLTGVRVQAYHFEFIASNLNTGGLQGYFEDNYLHTRTSLDLSGTTVANFSIENIAGSYARDRFRIVFAPSVVLPVTFTSIKGYLQDKNINVEWSVENEMNIKQYEIEKSINGTQFTSLAIKAATANGGHSARYLVADANPVEGYNYYRVKSVDINGKTAYTNVVKVLVGSIKQDIVIYPNPITDGMIHLQLTNQPQGKYGLRLLNKLGQVILAKQIIHAEGSSTEIIKWDYSLAHGMYELEVTQPGGTVKNINLLY